MSLGTETRAALDLRGRKLGIHKNLLLSPGVGDPTKDHVAEAFEAILGAVYVDAGHSLADVKEVLASTGLDTHRFLSADTQSQDAQEEKELAQLRAAEERVRMQQVAGDRLSRRASRREKAKEAKSEQQNQSPNSAVDDLQRKDDKSEAVAQDLQPAQSPDEAAPKPMSPLIRYGVRKPTPAAQTYARAHSRLSTDGNLLSDEYSKPAEVVSSTEAPQTSPAEVISVTEAPQTSPAPHVDQKEVVQISSEPDSPSHQADQAVAKSLEQRCQETLQRDKDLRNAAWISANNKARKLGENGQPTDVDTLYEILVAKMLDNERSRIAIVNQAAMREAAQERIEKKLKDDAWTSAKRRARKIENQGKPADVQAIYEDMASNVLYMERRRVARIERKEAKRAEELAAARARILEDTTIIQLQSPPGVIPQLKEATQDISGRKEARTDAPVDPQEPTTAPEDTAESQDHASTISQNDSSTTAIISREAQEAPVSPPVEAVPKHPRAEKPAAVSIPAHRQYKEDSQKSSKSVDQLEKDIIDSHNDAWQGAGAIVHTSPYPDGKQVRKAELKEKAKSKSKSQMKLEETDTNAKSVAGPEIYESEVDRMMEEISKDDDDRGTAVPAISPSTKKPAFEFSFEKPLASAIENDNKTSSVPAQVEAESISAADVHVGKETGTFGSSRRQRKLRRAEERAKQAANANIAAEARALLTGNLHTRPSPQCELSAEEVDEQDITHEEQWAITLEADQAAPEPSDEFRGSTTPPKPGCQRGNFKWSKKDRKLVWADKSPLAQAANPKSSAPLDAFLDANEVTDPSNTVLISPLLWQTFESEKLLSSQLYQKALPEFETQPTLQPDQELTERPEEDSDTLFRILYGEESSAQSEKGVSAIPDIDLTAQPEQMPDAQPEQEPDVQPGKESASQPDASVQPGAPV
jgi:hypothetical protein